MANWYGTSRSNYFKVKDADAFVADMAKYGIDHTSADDGTTFAVFGGDEGYWPSEVWGGESIFCDEKWSEHFDAVQFDIIEVIMPHLRDNEVCVLQSAGAEKLRYVTGTAQAFTNKKIISIDIDDIYALAAKKFKVPVADISLAQY